MKLISLSYFLLFYATSALSVVSMVLPADKLTPTTIADGAEEFFGGFQTISIKDRLTKDMIHDLNDLDAKYEGELFTGLGIYLRRMIAWRLKKSESPEYNEEEPELQKRITKDMSESLAELDDKYQNKMGDAFGDHINFLVDWHLAKKKSASLDQETFKDGSVEENPLKPFSQETPKPKKFVSPLASMDPAARKAAKGKDVIVDESPEQTSAGDGVVTPLRADAKGFHDATVESDDESIMSFAKKYYQKELALRLSGSKEEITPHLGEQAPKSPSADDIEAIYKALNENEERRINQLPTKERLRPTTSMDKVFPDYSDQGPRSPSAEDIEAIYKALNENDQQSKHQLPAQEEMRPSTLTDKAFPDYGNQGPRSPSAEDLEAINKVMKEDDQQPKNGLPQQGKMRPSTSSDKSTQDYDEQGPRPPSAEDIKAIYEILREDEQPAGGSLEADVPDWKKEGHLFPLSPEHEIDGPGGSSPSDKDWEAIQRAWDEDSQASSEAVPVPGSPGPERNIFDLGDGPITSPDDIPSQRDLPNQAQIAEAEARNTPRYREKSKKGPLLKTLSRGTSRLLWKKTKHLSLMRSTPTQDDTVIMALPDEEARRENLRSVSLPARRKGPGKIRVDTSIHW